ncbi:MAG: hypothetical protein FJ202_04325 [Gemmatimonadetes bacterium]|nr:hypothetical protein [Gemmatimonadota bacterium]
MPLVTRQALFVPPTRKVLFLAAYLAAYAIVLGLVRDKSPPFPAIADTAYMVFRVTLTLALWWAARCSVDRHLARGWYLLAAGQAFAVFGNATWVYSDLTGVETENSTYLAWTVPQSVLTLAGYWRMMAPKGGVRGRPGDWIDAAALAVASLSIAWYFIAARLVTTVYDDSGGAALLIADLAASSATLMFATAVWLRSPQGLAPGAMPRMAIAAAMMLAADLVIEDQLLDGSYQPGSLLDVWYGLAILLQVIAADRHCYYRPPAEEPPATPARSIAWSPRRCSHR